jgi:hypothetical protein
MTALIVGPTEFNSPWSGLGVGEDIMSLKASIESGDWIATGLAGVSTALSAAAAITDPIGAALSAGVGWVIDHLNPLREWLQHLTGDPYAVEGFARTWSTISVRLDSCSTSLTDSANGLQDLDGNFVRVYREYVVGLDTALRAEANVASAISTGFQIASGIVKFVYTLVRDAIADIIGKAIAWVAEALFSLGLAAPGIIGQVVTTVAKWSARVGEKVKALLSSMKTLKKILGGLHGGAEKLTDKVTEAGNALSKRMGFDLESAGGSVRDSTKESLTNSTQDFLAKKPAEFFDHLTDGQVTKLVVGLQSSNVRLADGIAKTLESSLSPLQVRALLKELYGDGDTPVAHAIHAVLP